MIDRYPSSLLSLKVRNWVLILLFFLLLILLLRMRSYPRVQRPRIAILLASLVGNFDKPSSMGPSDPDVLPYTYSYFKEHVLDPNKDDYEIHLFGHTNDHYLIPDILATYDFIAFDDTPQDPWTLYPFIRSVVLATKLALDYSSTHNFTYQWIFWTRYDLKWQSPFIFKDLNPSLFYTEKACLFHVSGYIPDHPLLPATCYRAYPDNRFRPSRECVGDFYFAAPPVLWSLFWLNFEDDLETGKFLPSSCCCFHGLARGRLNYLATIYPAFQSVGYYKLREVDYALVRFTKNYHPCTDSNVWTFDLSRSPKEEIYRPQTEMRCDYLICHCDHETLRSLPCYMASRLQFPNKRALP